MNRCLNSVQRAKDLYLAPPWMEPESLFTAQGAEQLQYAIVSLTQILLSIPISLASAPSTTTVRAESPTY